MTHKKWRAFIEVWPIILFVSSVPLGLALGWLVSEWMS